MRWPLCVAMNGLCGYMPENRVAGWRQSTHDAALENEGTMLRLLSALAVVLSLTSVALAQEVEIKEIVIGTGEEAVVGAEVTVHYTGWLEDGTKFDSSLDRQQPFSFTPGVGQVIRGWEQGVVGMKVGGKRELIIPPELGYGSRGAGGVIPPDATLRFEIELLKVAASKFSNLDNAGLKEKIAAGAKVIDIRRPDEWQATGVVEGSQLLTFFDANGQVNPEFFDELAAIADKDDEIVLICQLGNRSLVLSRFMSERAGYTKIRNVSGGIAGWIGEGNAVTKATPPEKCWLC